LDSNITGTPHAGRRRRRPRRRTADGTARVRPEPRSPHSRPLLEPTPCDATPVPFATLNLDPRLLEGLRDLGYLETRPIQSAVIPLALKGDDLIASAETGTGKTAAFVVPIVQKLLQA